MRQKLRLSMFALGVSALLLAEGARADDKQPLPIPRFVSMKHGEINVRVGPGLRYQIAWVFKRKEMPVEVIAEFDTWRQIRDWEGTEGWVNQTALAGARTIIIKGEIRALRRSADKAAEPVAQVEPGVIGKLLECPTASPDWCRIEVNDVRGWLRRTEFWGVYPTETYPQ
ncbi:MAG TPA: SH3 domain-containing protein [Aliidongia sp.]|nr:SH3 domain-containing protein [Aliidongia sp.]